MAEQSSTATTFRATVMLLCVVLIPLAAVCGTSCPGVVKAIQEGRLPTIADFRGSGAAKSGESEAPPFVPQGSAVAPTASMQAGTGLDRQSPPGGFSPLRPETSASQYLGTSPANRAGSDVVPVGYESPAGAGPAAFQGQSTTFPQRNDLAGKNLERGVDRGLSSLPQGDGRLVAPDRTGMATASGGGAASFSANDVRQFDRDQPDADKQFHRLQDRLKQLGATYYLLETWGDRKDEFRFYCKMSMGGNANVTRAFECVDADPLRAMADVLQQVEQWQIRGGTSSAEPAGGAMQISR